MNKRALLAVLRWEGSFFKKIKRKEATMTKTVAEILVERLIDWGVDTIFGLPGDGINGVFEALRVHQEKIKFVQVRHEESAAFAACGYAKHSGRLGVCLATSGPGGIHLLNGLYDAKFDGQPVLAITGHTFHDLIGTHYQQDLDLDKLFMDVTAYNERIMGPAHVCNVVDEAIKTALGRHAVAHINIPKDIQQWSDGKVSIANVLGHSADIRATVQPLPSFVNLQAAVKIINEGKKIVILAGRGCLNARQEVLELAEKLNAVIIKPLLGKAVVADDHPSTTGGIGLLGTAPSQDAMKECDTLILAGTSFPYMEFYPKQKVKTVQIDIDPARIGLRHQVDIGLEGDCSKVLEALGSLIRPKTDSSFLEESQRRMEKWNKLLRDQGTREDMPLKPQVVAYQLNQLINDDAIVCTDTGTVTSWAARYIKIRGKMQFSASGTLASMANGLGYSIGAAMANPGRQIISLCGDGGFTMLMGEMATLVKYNLPVKVIVFKNNAFGQIKWEQIAFDGNPEFGNDLHPIDFALFAQACGALSYKLEDPHDAEAVLMEALAAPGPALVEATIDPNEPPMPGHINSRQALHFTESMMRGEKDRWKILKTVMEDQIREVI
jgi:pyruvate dehydrogenase (quinone)